MINFCTGVLAGSLISKFKLTVGELRNWLGENGNGFIGVTPGESNGLMPGIREQFPNDCEDGELTNFWNSSYKCYSTYGNM